MASTRQVSSYRKWSSTGRWALYGTLACILASLLFNHLLFQDFDGEVLARITLSAILLPILLVMPLFFYFGTRMRSLAIANVRLGRVARIDSLTACLNRGAFTAEVDSWLRNHPEAQGALMMIDADNFKAINDLYGHAMGDEALTIMARAIRRVLRSGDIVGRMGGEEFAVFLPGVDQYQAWQVAERIREAVHRASFAPYGEARPLSVSIGGAVFEGRTCFADLFRIADQRLYGAKHAGRNIAAIVLVEDHPGINLKHIA